MQVRTLKNVVDLVIARLSGGTPTNDTRFHKKRIAARALLMLGTLLRMEIFEAYKQDGGALAPSRYVAAYPLKIQEDARGNKYVDIPVSYIDLPYGAGIHGVYYSDFPEDRFMRRNNPTVTAKSRSSQASKRQSYFLRGNRIYFDRRDVDKNIDKRMVDVELIVSVPSPDDWNEQLPVTDFVLDQLVDRLYNWFANVAPHDTVDDERDVNSQPSMSQ